MDLFLYSYQKVVHYACRRKNRDKKGAMKMKKLYRSEKNRMIAGVCGGIAEYFGIDPTLVRLGFVALSFMLGGGVLVYILAAIIIPKEGTI